jgi:hypothetical protein
MFCFDGGVMDTIGADPRRGGVSAHAIQGFGAAALDIASMFGAAMVLGMAVAAAGISILTMI